jgi:hypothetical protein
MQSEHAPRNPVKSGFCDGRLKIGCTGFGPIEDLMTGFVASSRSTKLGRRVHLGFVIGWAKRASKDTNNRTPYQDSLALRQKRL